MEKTDITLSVALAVRNEEANLSACLSSVKDFAGEIVIVDGGSTDKTVAIAKSFGVHVIRAGNPPIFHINKQKALDACRGEWILQLDADEVVTPELKKEILDVIKDGAGMNGYYIPRKNFFLGHWLRKGGQYPDYVVRLVRREKAHFPQKSVHEQIAVEGKVGYLVHPMLHNSFPTRKEYWKKADAYTSLTAQELAAQKVPKTIGSYVYYTVWKPLVTFLLIFFRHKGFVDGIAGFEFALYSGMHFAIAYRKFLKTI